MPTPTILHTFAHLISCSVGVLIDSILPIREMRVRETKLTVQNLQKCGWSHWNLWLTGSQPCHYSGNWWSLSGLNHRPELNKDAHKHVFMIENNNTNVINFKPLTKCIFHCCLLLLKNGWKCYQDGYVVFSSQFILLDTCVTLCILQRTKISVVFLWSYLDINGRTDQ